VKKKKLDCVREWHTNLRAKAAKKQVTAVLWILIYVRKIDPKDIWIDPDPGQRADVIDLSLCTLLLSIWSKTG